APYHADLYGPGVYGLSVARAGPVYRRRPGGAAGRVVRVWRYGSHAAVLAAGEAGAASGRDADTRLPLRLDRLAQGAGSESDSRIWRALGGNAGGVLPRHAGRRAHP